MKRLCALLLAVLMLVSCSGNVPADTTVATDPVTDAPVTLDPNAPDPAYPEADYLVISKEEYLDKTTAGFLSQLVGFLSGFEFVTLSGGRCRVAMPDSWFVYCRGPYAEANANKKHTDKHLRNKETQQWEVWFDDDFSVDVVNQYILSDMYRSKSTISAKYITDGWVKYDVYDMGGGQRSVGAYALASKNNYLPSFAGNTEYGNWYSYCTVAYLGADTMGMNAAGMPQVAADICGLFASMTGDRDNVLWAQMFGTMMSYAYFETDIKTVILKASAVFPDGSHPLEIVDEVFEIYEKYPTNWRSAYKEFENNHYVKDVTRNTDTDINCGFVLLDLLYGGGDYYETCKIASLAGYDCESTAGIALSVLGIMGGMEILPEETNTLIWLDGEGTLVNLNDPNLEKGYWMTADGLPDRIKIATVVDKYRANFESVLLENGGAMDDKYYYIPRTELGSYKAIELSDPDFESGKLDAYTVKGDVKITSSATMGKYAVEIKNGGELYATVNGLEKGKTYALNAYILSKSGATLMFARESGGANAVCVSVNKTEGTPKYPEQSTVRRTLTFTATAETMEIGVTYIGGDTTNAIVDSLCLIQIEEKSLGTVKISEPVADNYYKGVVKMDVTSESEKEIYLKVTFRNPSSAIVDVAVSTNGRAYASGAFHKTAKDITGMTQVDFVYLPVVLKNGENTVKLDLGNNRVYIDSVELVDVITTWAD